jgi:hypothetical protein
VLTLTVVPIICPQASVESSPENRGAVTTPSSGANLDTSALSGRAAPRPHPTARPGPCLPAAQPPAGWPDFGGYPSPMPLATLLLILVRAQFLGRHRLALESLALRQQLAVLGPDCVCSRPPRARPRCTRPASGPSDCGRGQTARPAAGPPAPRGASCAATVPPPRRTAPRRPPPSPRGPPARHQQRARMRRVRPTPPRGQARARLGQGARPPPSPAAPSSCSSTSLLLTPVTRVRRRCTAP